MRSNSKRFAVLSACAALLSSVCLTGFPVSAETENGTAAEQVWEEFTYVEDGGSIVITGCAETVENVEIPEEIGGIPVTGIREEAFCHCPNLTEITIPATITEIGRAVFVDAPLTAIETADDNPVFCSVDGVLFDKAQTALLAYPNGREGAYCIPDGVSRIGEAAFLGSEGLTDIFIPESVETIGIFAFSRCSSLTAVEIPEGVTNMESGTFTYCSALSSVSLPSTLSSINSLTFWNCTALESIVIPEGVTEIGGSAFSCCEALQMISLPSTLTTLGNSVFNMCQNLAYIEVDAENPVFSSADGALYSKDMTKLIQYPYIPHSSVCILPDTVTEIGTYAFSFNSALSVVVLPHSLTYIGYGAFNCCNPKIYYRGTLEEWKAITIEESNGVVMDSYDIHCEYTTAVGDINNDTIVSAADAALLLQELAVKGVGNQGVLTEEQRGYADFDGNSILDAGDAAMILQQAAKDGSTKYPGSMTIPYQELTAFFEDYDSKITQEDIS